MELIDIWHFILSEILLRNQADQDKSLTALTDSLSDSSTQNVINFDDQHIFINELDLIAKFELLIALSVSRRIELALFASIMTDCEISWTELYCQYVGKNVLNMFRLD